MGVPVSELEDLMSELNVAGEVTKPNAGLVKYLTDCGGYDVMDFAGADPLPTKQVKAAQAYEEKMKTDLDPSEIIVVREVDRVWLYLTSFYHRQEHKGYSADSAHEMEQYKKTYEEEFGPQDSSYDDYDTEGYEDDSE